METIIVNASAAKSGGAREILRAFLKNGIVSGNDYYVFCPYIEEFAGAPDNVIFKEVSTSGLKTFLFSILFVYYFVFLLKASKVVSFNNVNCAFKSGIVTYFHQEKALNGSGLRYLLIRLGVRLSKRGRFIVQSDRVKRELARKIGVDEKKIEVLWPGVRRLPSYTRFEALKIIDKQHVQDVLQKISHRDIAIFPVYDPHATHKDFDFIKRIKCALNSVGIVTVSLCPKGSNIADLDLGEVAPHELDAIYTLCKYMVISSKFETLCLPMFEFAQTGRLILARRADFIDDFVNRYPGWLCNLKLLDSSFDVDKVLTLLDEAKRPLSQSEIDLMCRGEWTL